MNAKSVLIIAVFVALAAASYALDLRQYLTLDSLRDHRAALLAFVEVHGLGAALLFITAYTLVVAFSIPGAAIMTLAGGLLFGAVVGALFSVIGATFGSSILFLAARTALGDLLRRKAGPLVTQMAEGFQRNAFNYLLFLRLVPAFPFWAVNLAAALLGMGFTQFLLATFLGIIPASAVFSSFGAGLGRVFDAGGAVTLSSALSPQLLAGLIGLGLLALVPVIVERMRRPS
ncbi:TVP38/TMEM64 family protein [uncultured Rhodoblastus sp.]|uniref:TVP38/TMEM64 family protein n=1 Tax=uncultured Rhodoblastus sp. TaxID=543037 RepID=UPI0025CF994B|nr:TVP38/TMEM64 family protein [uncultured Rhodoblastus sp.]